MQTMCIGLCNAKKIKNQNKLEIQSYLWGEPGYNMSSSQTLLLKSIYIMYVQAIIALYISYNIKFK